MQIVESKGHCLIQSIWRLEYNSFEQVSSRKFTWLPLKKHMEKSWSLTFSLGIEIMVIEN